MLPAPLEMNALLQRLKVMRTSQSKLGRTDPQSGLPMVHVKPEIRLANPL